jgi:hypothetical protein
MLPDGEEIHPAELVTVYVYVPGASPEIVELVPVPVVVIPPGFRVNVQVPGVGKPFNITLPVAIEQFGWVIVPTLGAAGVAGWAFITMLPVGGDVQPAALVTV